MGDLGLPGVRRGNASARPSATAHRVGPADLVERRFSAPTPNRLWVADLTYVKTHGPASSTWPSSLDVFSRVLVGWQVSTAPASDLALDALEMAIWARSAGDLAGLVHHSDRGVQYLAIRYTERLAEAGRGEPRSGFATAYDNALAESVNGLYKAELIYRRGPWKTVEHVELATAAWVDWWNQRRLHGACGISLQSSSKRTTTVPSEAAQVA